MSQNHVSERVQMSTFCAPLVIMPIGVVGLEHKLYNPLDLFIISTPSSQSVVSATHLSARFDTLAAVEWHGNANISLTGYIIANLYCIFSNSPNFMCKITKIPNVYFLYDERVNVKSALRRLGVSCRVVSVVNWRLTC